MSACNNWYLDWFEASYRLDSNCGTVALPVISTIAEVVDGVACDKCHVTSDVGSPRAHQTTRNSVNQFSSCYLFVFDSCKLLSGNDFMV